ncbi:unnamed protein product [Cunninghamella echinulata]
MSSSTDSVTYIPSSPSLENPTLKTISPIVQPAPMEATSNEYGQRHSIPKTSLSHPINISWILPNEYISLLSYCQLPKQMDILDLTNPVIEMQLGPQIEEANYHCQKESIQLMGNLALSSCPGKKVRLSGPVRGRAAINRDLDLDFTRMKSFGITTLVCCLDDNELEFLGAPWETYSTIAKKYDLEVFRLPMVEGSCPDTLEEVDVLVNKVNEKIYRGENVLTHCRGGVGRAGLFACCWLINNMFCHSAERAIRYIRARRSPKAIETMRQAEFVIHYAQFIHNKLNQRHHHHQQQQSEQDHHQNHQHQQQGEGYYFNHFNDHGNTNTNNNTITCHQYNSNNNHSNNDISNNNNIKSINNINNPLSSSLPSSQPPTSKQISYKPLRMKHTDQTLSVPSVVDISNLERSMCNNYSLANNTTHYNNNSL